jgi:hypothetical protein
VDDVHLGRYDKLLLQLEEHRSFFQNTDAKLQEFVTPVMLRYGFTEDTLARAMQEYSEHLGHGR